ncbi:MAG TPA: hypothetical protein VFQ23_21720 [Anaerolineales bacterium]|nr:hypothetical protein [Anaerolineales bacterium]
MNDVRQMIYGSLVLFFLVLAFWFSIIYVSACGFTLSCNQADHIVVRTPVPTLIPRAHSNAQPVGAVGEFNQCQVLATDLIGAWVAAGHPEATAFSFADVNGQPCEGTFAEDVQPLFTENSIWYDGSIGCVSCHNAGQPDRNAGLDLSTYGAMSSADIFGGDDWQNSVLYDVLVNRELVPEGHSTDNTGHAVIVYAGQAMSEPEVTPTP